MSDSLPIIKGLTQSKGRAEALCTYLKTKTLFKKHDRH